MKGETSRLSPMSLSGNKTQATAHLYIKNDGVIPISKWCAAVYVVDLTGKGAQADIQIGEGPASRGEVCQDLPTKKEMCFSFYFPIRLRFGRYWAR